MKRTAKNSPLLAAIKAQFNSRIFKEASGMLNGKVAHPHKVRFETNADAVVMYLSCFFNYGAWLREEPKWLELANKEPKP